MSWSPTRSSDHCPNLKVKVEADTADEDTDTDTHANLNHLNRALFLAVPCHPSFSHAHAYAAQRSRLLTAATRWPGTGQGSSRSEGHRSQGAAGTTPVPPGAAVAQAPRVARRRL